MCLLILVFWFHKNIYCIHLFLYFSCSYVHFSWFETFLWLIQTSWPLFCPSPFFHLTCLPIRLIATTFTILFPIFSSMNKSKGWFIFVDWIKFPCPTWPRRYVFWEVLVVSEVSSYESVYEDRERLIGRSFHNSQSDIPGRWSGEESGSARATTGSPAPAIHVNARAKTRPIDLVNAISDSLKQRPAQARRVVSRRESSCAEILFLRAFLGRGRKIERHRR